MAEAFIVIDKQNDMEADGGALTAGKAAQEATPYVIDQIRGAVASGKLVIIGLDTHQVDDPEFMTLARHCVKGEWGWELVPPLKAFVEGERRAGRVVDFSLETGLQPETALLMEASRVTGKGMIALVEKRSFNLFGEQVVTDLVQIWGVRECRFVGVGTHLGVLHSIEGALSAGLKSALLKRGVADFAPNRAAESIQRMQQAGVVVVE